MERQILYPCASATSIDSWDFENVKYLRKLSNSSSKFTPLQFDQNQKFDIQNTQIVSDEQFLHYDETEQRPLYDMNEVAGINSASGGGNTLGMLNDTIDNDEDVEDLSVLNPERGPLDNCYLLDVVTIRNESVLAKRISANQNVRLGSDGYETASSVASSVEEHAEMVEYYSENCSKSPTALNSESRMNENFQNPRNVKSSCSKCPYCGDRKLSNSSNHSIVERDDPEALPEYPAEYGDTSHVLTENDEVSEDARSNSPYYVKLRRDLYASTCTSPHLKQPRNFGIDQQGQLLIDYTPNWEGLEKYLRALRLCN